MFDYGKYDKLNSTKQGQHTYRVVRNIVLVLFIIGGLVVTHYA